MNIFNFYWGSTGEGGGVYGISLIPLVACLSGCARSAGHTERATALKFCISAHLNMNLKWFSQFFEFCPRLPPGAKKGGEIDPK